MTIPVTAVVHEYEEICVSLTDDQQRVLSRSVGPQLTVLPGEQRGTYRLKATSFVGTIVIPDLRILIKPKVATSNLFHLLEAGGRPLTLGPEIFDYDTTGDLLPAFSTFFVRHLEASLGRGLTRRYHDMSERLVALRGRVHIPSLQRSSGLPIPVTCDFEEYTADIALNRIIKTAAVRLSRLPGVTSSTRRSLLQLISRFDDVGLATPEDLAKPTYFDRLNVHFRGVERLARLVMAGASTLDTAGTTGAATFLIDMNKVFEEFVEARLTRLLQGRLVVRPQYRAKLDIEGEIAIKPDLVFQTANKTNVYVADSKYKVTADGFGREGDYYQLLAYTTALDLPEGLLVYCQHDGDAPPRVISVGPAAKRLRTVAIRLDRSIGHVEAELKQLADDIRISAVRSSAPPVSPAHRVRRAAEVA